MCLRAFTLLDRKLYEKNMVFWDRVTLHSSFASFSALAASLSGVLYSLATTTRHVHKEMMMTLGIIPMRSTRG